MLNTLSRLSLSLSLIPLCLLLSLSLFVLSLPPSLSRSLPLSPSFHLLSFIFLSFILFSLVLPPFFSRSLSIYAMTRVTGADMSGPPSWGMPIAYYVCR